MLPTPSLIVHLVCSAVIGGGNGGRSGDGGGDGCGGGGRGEGSGRNGDCCDGIGGGGIFDGGCSMLVRDFGDGM